MMRFSWLLIFLSITTMQSQSDFVRCSYTRFDGVMTPAYIESINWQQPFESIRVKTKLEDPPTTIAIKELIKLTLSEELQFVRQMVWKAPVWETDHTGLNYSHKDVAFLKLIGYGKVSLYSYFDGTSQRIVYQTKSNRFIEFVPPNATPSPKGKPLDYKDQIRADFNSSFYRESDLKQLTYSLLDITEFVRNYNSYIPGDNGLVAHSDVVGVETVPRIDNVEEPEFDVPFAAVEKSPVLQGCETLATEQEIRACLSNRLEVHFQQHFKFPKEAKPEDSEKKFFVQFIFEKDGSFKIQTMRIPHPSIETEIRRIFEKIPKLKPGLMRDKPVRVVYMQAFRMKRK